MNQILKLPNELIEIVAKYLDRYDQLSLAKQNRFLYKLLLPFIYGWKVDRNQLFIQHCTEFEENERWEEVKKNLGKYKKYIVRASRLFYETEQFEFDFFNNLKEYEESIVSQKHFDQLLNVNKAKFSSLVVYKLHFIPHDLDLSGLGPLLTNIKSLSIEYVYNSKGWLPDFYNPNLRSLEFKTRELDEIKSKVISKIFPNLEKLVLRCNLFNNALPVLEFPSLNYLHIELNPAVLKVLVPISTSCPKLKYLSINLTVSYNLDKLVTPKFAQVTQLELMVRINYNTGRSKLDKLLTSEALPKLRRLIYKTINYSDTILLNSNLWPNLEVLKLNEHTLDSVLDLPNFINLKALDINISKNLSQYTFQSFFTQLPNLESFSMNGNPVAEWFDFNPSNKLKYLTLTNLEAVLVTTVEFLVKLIWLADLNLKFKRSKLQLKGVNFPFPTTQFQSLTYIRLVYAPIQLQNWLERSSKHLFRMDLHQLNENLTSSCKTKYFN